MSSEENCPGESIELLLDVVAINLDIANHFIVPRINDSDQTIVFIGLSTAVANIKQLINRIIDAGVSVSLGWNRC